MKNLLNCHTIGLHSFPLSCENGLYRRIFYADENHHLWKWGEIAIHPHHVDIKITVLEGHLYNQIFEANELGKQYNKFKWNSQILNGNGGFEYIGVENLMLKSNNVYTTGETIQMSACELHTVRVMRDEICVWLIDEFPPTSNYDSINYSQNDLTKWTPNGLYQEVGDDVKDKYIGKYLNLL